MLQADARKCRFCDYRFQQQSVQAVNPPKESSTPGCIAIGIVSFIILAAIGQCSSDDTASNHSDQKAVENAAVKPAEPYAVRLQREVDSLIKNPRLTDVPSDKVGLLMSAALIGGRIKIYQDAPANLTPEDERLRKEFRRLQSAYQRDAFPKLRNAQARLLRTVLWESDVEVAATGGRNENLRFTGGIFASNKGIATAQEAIGDTLEIMRFRRATYEWYRGSENTYYDLKPLPDGELADFTSANRWIAIREPTEPATPAKLPKQTSKSDDPMCDPSLAKSVGLECN